VSEKLVTLGGADFDAQACGDTAAEFSLLEKRANPSANVAQPAREGCNAAKLPARMTITAQDKDGTANAREFPRPRTKFRQCATGLSNG